MSEDKEFEEVLISLLKLQAYYMSLFLKVELEKCGWKIENCDTATKYILARFLAVMDIIKEAEGGQKDD